MMTVGEMIAMLELKGEYLMANILRQEYNDACAETD